jgi:hypothetical protein
MRLIPENLNNPNIVAGKCTGAMQKTQKSWNIEMYHLGEETTVRLAWRASAKPLSSITVKQRGEKGKVIIQTMIKQ